ncbi:FAD/NAD(P)-binding domain-containing protein [Sistotremastrum niveocremeum HHB9708]|uniref:FAD/NAD(P)-binding domain-containing protein n=1 Tax=Sistotremastrum niveocremeum HHB9708 TaxID=1314777 RepID=A0A164P6D5_9AGAM|nr:FAD/NAD(P)-binding domain-containing protein [Sistotremastrum niveocremeum HHB9708]
MASAPLLQTHHTTATRLSSPALTMPTLRDGHSILDHIAKNDLSAARSLFLSLPSDSFPSRASFPKPVKDKVGIIGAGIAGLYAAMILKSLGYDYEILEASQRIGGRAYTYHFNLPPPGCPENYDYYDIGAMRFPDIPWMQRVFDLFKLLKVEQIPYFLSAPGTFLHFNGHQWPADKPQYEVVGDGTVQYLDVFNVTVSNGGAVPDSFILHLRVPAEDAPGSPDAVWWGLAFDRLREPFKLLNEVPPAELASALAKAWATLLPYDSHSVRSYLLSPEVGYPNAVVTWLETFQTATGLYDRSLINSVMDSLDFDWPTGSPMQDTILPCHKVTSDSDPVLWKCIKGGSSRVTDQMAQTLDDGKILKGQRVTRLQLREDDASGTVEVFLNDAASPARSYSHVICTTPLGVLGEIDTLDLGLAYSQNTAIRSLLYDSSVKVAVKFKTRWWEDPDIVNPPIFGGTSSTDLPIRTIVYPSYGIPTSLSSDDVKPPGVLMISYLWSQDAIRLGAQYPYDPTVQSEDPRHRQFPLDHPLLQLTLNNLERVHGVSRDKFGEVEDWHFFNWNASSFARGPFVVFSPGQFQSPSAQQNNLGLYTSLLFPNKTGTFFIAGEAASIHHGWFLASLNSAWRAVHGVLQSLGAEEDKKRLYELWGIPSDLDVKMYEECHDIVTGKRARGRV